MDTFYSLKDIENTGSFLLLFDPLDGSSNIDINASIGTIFIVLKSPKNAALNLKRQISYKRVSNKSLLKYAYLWSTDYFNFNRGSGVWLAL